MSIARDVIDGRASAGRKATVAGLLTAAACGLALLGSTAISLREVDYAESGFRRFRTDQVLAIGSSLRQRYPNSLPGLGGASWDPDIDLYYHSVLGNQVRAEGIRPWQPWRLVRDRPFLRAYGPDWLPSYDDPGRAAMLEMGFRVLGGISPFLIFWIGPMAMALVLAWFVWESMRAARVVAGLLFALLLVTSPYVVESLALSRSAVGFHLVALVLLLALALPALRPRAPGWAAWLTRAGLAGVAFAACVLSRSGVLSMLPAFLAVLACGSARAGSPSDPARRRAAGFLGASILLLAPFVLLRPAQQHDTWAGMWEGLGDYDRTKGHIWGDRAAGEHVWRVLGRAGELPRRGGDVLVAWLARPEVVEVLRRDVLEHIRTDPGWYARILARRAFATVCLERLWPQTSRDGYSYSQIEAPGGERNLLNKYWGYTTTADWLGVGSLRVELPATVLAAPFLLFVSWRLCRGRSERALGDAPLLVLGLLAMAALALPVIVTTASGTEPQAMVLVFYLGWGYLADQLWRQARGSLGSNVTAA